MSEIIEFDNLHTESGKAFNTKNLSSLAVGKRQTDYVIGVKSMVLLVQYHVGISGDTSLVIVQNIDLNHTIWNFLQHQRVLMASQGHLMTTNQG